MTVMLRRMLITERVRLLVLCGAITLWFLLMMLVYRETGPKLFQQASDTAMARGFNLRNFIDGDRVLAQLVGMAYTHPLFLVMMSTVVVALAARSCAGELEAGTIELTLARPIARRRYLLSYALFIALAAALLLAVSVIAANLFASALDVPGDMRATRVLVTGANALLLFLAIAGITMLASTLASSRGRALSAGIGMVVGMYFLTFFARAWEPLEPVGVLSLFHYFPATDVMLGYGVATRDIVVLGLVWVLATAAAVVRFERRDLV